MADNQPDPGQPQPQPDVVARIITTMAELGAAGAGHIADTVGIAYSTTTAKLRALEAEGRAEKFRTDDRRTLWRLTPNGQPADTDGEPVAGTGPDPDAEREAPAGDEPGVGVDEAAADTAAGATGEDDSSPQPDDAAPAQQPDATQPQPEPEPAPPATAADSAEAAAAPQGSGAPAKPRRRQGQLREEVLALLQAEPEHTFGATELSRRLDGASQGAIANALDKLITAGTAKVAQAKPTRWTAV